MFNLSFRDHSSELVEKLHTARDQISSEDRNKKKTRVRNFSEKSWSLTRTNSRCPLFPCNNPIMFEYVWFGFSKRETNILCLRVFFSRESFQLFI